MSTDSERRARQILDDARRDLINGSVQALVADAVALRIRYRELDFAAGFDACLSLLQSTAAEVPEMPAEILSEILTGTRDQLKSGDLPGSRDPGPGR